MNQPVMTARRVARDLLVRIDHGGAYANLVLATALEQSKLSAIDKGFVTELVYGTTRMRRACDALVDRFLTTSPDDTTRTVLRIGAYQLHFMNVPDHAAVAETVGLVTKRKRGLVNAVLRRVASTPVTWPSLATELSYPDWIVARLEAELGTELALKTLRRMNTAPPVATRDDGYTQDLASQWVSRAVAATAGETIADVCAAPGGKATLLATTTAKVLASDISPNRVSLIESNNHRLTSGLAVYQADATRPPLAASSCDAVLIDAPCSGLGALRRRPDARWRITPADVDDLVGLQHNILAACAPLVKPGGRLIYSVCTLTRAESIDHPIPDGFEVDPTPPPLGDWTRVSHGWRLLPHDADTDGMWLLRYRRQR